MMVDDDTRNNDEGGWECEPGEFEEVEIGDGEEEANEKSESFQISAPNTSCCYRMRSELRGNFFSLDELNGLDLDVEASFAPGPVWRSVVARSILFGFVVGGGLVYSILDYPSYNRWIWMGYLTHLTLMLTVAYFLLITICTLRRSSLVQPEKGGHASALVRWAWALYSIVAPMSVVVVLLYWTLEYQPGDSVTFKTVMNHAITCALVLIDGNLIGLIPLRLKQMVFVELVGLIWIIWTVIHSYSGLGDGDWEGEANDSNDNINDDVLYDTLNWQDSPGKAAVISVITLLVIIPIIFILCWALSMWTRWCKFDGSRRRVHQETPTKADERSEASLEEGDSGEIVADIY